MGAMLSLIPWYHWTWILPVLAGGGYLGFLFRVPLGLAAKAVPTVVWEWLGALLLVGLLAWWVYAQGNEHGKAEDAELVTAANQGKAAAEQARDLAIAANETNQSTIHALQDSQAQCEQGRIGDQAKQAKAMADRNAAATAAQKAYAKAQAELDVLHAGRCAAWAAAPACGER